MTAEGQAILASLAAVGAERRRRAADADLAARVAAIKHYQHRRFSLTYSDLLASSRFGPAARFFLDDLYGPHDFSQRDEQFARVVPGLVRLFPHELVLTVVALGDLHAALPGYAITALREALPVFGRKIKGFDMHDAVLTGVETRTSAPLRIDRGDHLQSPNTPGLYPAGEGAGYAGGILSAGVDGIKVGEAVARSLLGLG